VSDSAPAARLYPSWIEIPAADLDRALAFYRHVFALHDTPLYDDTLPSGEPMRIAVLLSSDKAQQAPGVSLVQSPAHSVGHGGPQINFHVGSGAALDRARAQAAAFGGSAISPIHDEGEGVVFCTLLDSEGNRIALSAYEPQMHADAP
jgi:predicted enzyme related to lactoylglutathione lyase